MAIYLKISAEANWAYDTGTEVATECFMSVKGVEIKDGAEEEAIFRIKTKLGEMVNIKPEHLEIITEEEYLENVGEQEDDDA